MKKMLFHAQNGTGKNGINFNDDILKKEKIFCNFNPKEFINNYKTFEDWENCAKNKIKSKSWNGYLKTVFEVAHYLSQYNTIEDFKNKIKTSEAKEIIKEIKSISGFGPAFTRDFLKECGRTDLVKPDTHIKNFFKKLFFKNHKKVSAEEIDKKAQEICKQFGENWTPYKLDKYIYLICSHNFYDIDKLYVDNYRKDLIEQIEIECKKTK